MHYETVWSFETARFRVTLDIAEECGYQYDGDDPEGETQAMLDSGVYVAFDSLVRVYLDGREIGADALGGSVYDAGRVSEFWTEHRDRDPMNRNCSIMRAKRGSNVVICHYFPDMVRIAVAEARKAIADIPNMRKAA